jgi:hypothetical protein
MAILFSLVFLKNRKIKYYTIFSILIMISTALITALYWSDIRLLSVRSYLVLSLFLISISSFREIEKAVDVLSLLIIIMEVGAMIALIFILVGYGPISSFPRPSSISTLFVYPFSLSPFGGGIHEHIRLTSIYDEPGSFSFVICIIAYLRYALNKDSRITMVILFLGMSTFSLAHVIFIIAFYILAGKKIDLNIISIVILPVLFISLFYFTKFGSLIDRFIFNRFIISAAADQYFTGDNRSEMFFNGLEILLSDSKIWLLGVNQYNIDNYKINLGENPLTPLIYNGILMSWTYYLYIILGSWISFKYKEYSFLAIILLIIQRPYLDSFGYSLMLLLAFWAFLHKINENKIKSKKFCKMSQVATVSPPAPLF